MIDSGVSASWEPGEIVYEVGSLPKEAYLVLEGFVNIETKDGLKLWLNALARFKSNNLLRMKGIIRVGNKVLLINAVQKVFHEPIVLDKWPFNDEKSKIVFITKNLKSNDLIKTIKVLNFKKQKKTKIDKLTFSKKDYTNQSTNCC